MYCDEVPKKVDHRQRRKQLADALMRLAATDGLEAVSLRHVAAAAGVSTGMVQHYFRTKDEMMTFAMDMVMHNMRARATAEVPLPDASPRQFVRSLLLQVLPLDEQRRIEGTVVLAFMSYAAVRPDVAVGLRESSRQMREFLAAQISAAHVGNASRVDPMHAATALLALVDGLGFHVIGRHYSADEAVAALDAQLDALFG
jgi:AcrR family transcriptional regulator